MINTIQIFGGLPEDSTSMMFDGDRGRSGQRSLADAWRYYTYEITLMDVVKAPTDYQDVEPSINILYMLIFT